MNFDLLAKVWGNPIQLDEPSEKKTDETPQFDIIMQEVKFQPCVPRLDKRGRKVFDALCRCWGNPFEVFGQATKSQFASLEELLNYHKNLDDGFIRLSQRISKKEFIDVNSLSDADKLIYKALTETDLPLFKILNVLGKITYMIETMRHIPKSDCSVTIWTEKNIPNIPSRTSSENSNFIITSEAQDVKKPTANAPNEAFGGGANSTGDAAEERIIAQTLLRYCNFSSLPKENPMYVKYIHQVKDFDVVTGQKFSEKPGIFKTSQVSDMSLTPYSKLLPFFLARFQPELLCQLIKPIEPHPFWFMNFAMPDLRKMELTSEILHKTFILMFRTHFLNLKALCMDADYKDCDQIQMMLCGAGIFGWPKELSAMMSYLTFNMAKEATEDIKYTGVLAAFTKAQAEEVEFGLKFSKYFCDLDIDEVIKRLFSFYKMLKAMTDYKRKNPGVVNKDFDIYFDDGFCVSVKDIKLI